MKLNTVIQVNFDVWEKLDRRIRDELIAVYPPGHIVGSREFYSRLPFADTRSLDLLKLLERVGLKPWRQVNSKRSDEFTFAWVREYEPKDFDSFQLLEPMGNPDLHDYCAADEQGNLWVKPSFFKKKQLVTGGEIDSLLVSADIRQALEAGGFCGMTFLPVIPRKDGRAVPVEKLWELTSDQRMPRLSDYCTFFDQHDRPVEGSAETAYQYIEEFYPISELHYRASTVRDWPWDFALTHELFWYGERRHTRRFVASQRFYQFCKTNKLKMDWNPVRIDLD